MTRNLVTLPASTLEKLVQLAQLLEQAEQLAREINHEARQLTGDFQVLNWTESWQAAPSRD